jgi:tetratricopeptide (TPR) repeat protein
MVFLVCFAVLLSGSLSAQSIQGSSERGPQDVSGNPLKTAHYEIYAESGAENSLPSLARELELRFEVYNQLFRFNPSTLSSLLKVRVFRDPAAFQSYVSVRLGGSRTGAVYLHYTNSNRRELVILKGSEDEAFMLSHQAFVQFLRGFIPNPPSWMREGFAIYFNTLRFDPVQETLSYEENLAWLETVKELGSKALSPREILMRDTIQIHELSSAGAGEAIFSRDFQVSSWALASYFLNSGEHFRSLTECFMVLSPSLSAMENSLAVMNRLSIWINFYDLDREFQSYLSSRKTFAELMENGRNAYAEGNAINAELSFLAAQDQRPTHYGPYYFLGLLYYEEGLFDAAEEHYRISLQFGADEALVSYALGINALSAGRIDDARIWLGKAAAIDPARYKARAEDLLRRF